MNKPSKNTRTTLLDVQAIRRHILATMGVGLWVARDSHAAPKSQPCRFAVAATPVGKPTVQYDTTQVLQQKNKKQRPPSPTPQQNKKQRPSATVAKDTKIEKSHVTPMQPFMGIRVNADRYDIMTALYGKVLIMTDWYGVSHGKDDSQAQIWQELMEYLKQKDPTVQPIRLSLDYTIMGDTEPEQQGRVLEFALMARYPQISSYTVMVLTPIAGVYLGGLLDRRIPVPEFDELYGNPALIDQFLV